MQGNKRSRDTKNAVGDVAVDLFPFLRVYKDGHIERFVCDTFVPASGDIGLSGVSTRDVLIDEETGVSARLFLPAMEAGRRLPVVVYFHGGAFCTGSAFSLFFHRYAASLSARARALVVSVDYGLAPERPIPAAYDDAWAALRWASSSSDPWLASCTDPARTFLAGESSGANIAHNVALRSAAANANNDRVDIEGLILVHPFFWGTERLPCESDCEKHGHMFPPEVVDTLWPFVTAGAAGNDDPRLNPPSEEVASLQCRRVLMAVASKDVMRDRGRRYAAQLRDGAWTGEVTLVESVGEDHCFHLFRPGHSSAIALMDRVAEFVNKRTPTSTPTPIRAAWIRTSDGYRQDSSDRKHRKSQVIVPRAVTSCGLTIRPAGKAQAARYGFVFGKVRPNMVQKHSSIRFR